MKITEQILKISSKIKASLEIEEHKARCGENNGSSESIWA